MVKKLVRAFQTLLRVAMVLTGAGIILGGTFTGALLVPLGNYYLSPLGIYLFGRFGVQQVRARKHNRYWKRAVRTRFLQAASLYEVTNSKVLLLPRSYREWHKELWKQYSFTMSWNDIVYSAILRASRDRGFTDIPSVGIVIPIFGIPVKDVEDTVNSILRQSFPRITKVILAFNQPDNHQLRDALREYMKTLDSRFQLLELPAGKRGAMAEGYRALLRAGCEILANVDADTVLQGDSITNSVMMLLLDPKLAGVTSDVQVRNASENLLTRQTAFRYLFANRVERAAQHNKVTCMSGPLMVVWAVPIARVLSRPDLWEKQEFLWVLVGPGDDRRLTQVLLMLGYNIAFGPDVETETDCPVTIKRWLRQQLRWARSALRGFWSEIFAPWFWSPRFSMWSRLDELYLAVFGYILAGVAGRVVYNIVTIWSQHGAVEGLKYAIPYTVIVLSANLLRTGAAMANNRDRKQWIVFFYVGYQIAFLAWIRIYALPTITDSSWLSRGKLRRGRLATQWLRFRILRRRLKRRGRR